MSLFVTCLVDQLWPDVGVDTVRLLRRLGADVHFDPRQTCCGQPGFNAGYVEEGLRVAKALLATFAGDAREIVVPSGSCTAMIRHLPEHFEEGTKEHRQALDVASRTHELGTFVHEVLGVEDVGATYPGRLTWHDACHGLRDLGIKETPRRLLRNVRGAELVELRNCETCCGFGGTFSVTYPELSVAMVDQKIEEFESERIDYVVSGDVSCLLQIGGRLERRGSRVKALHLAQVLAGRGAA